MKDYHEGPIGHHPKHGKCNVSETMITGRRRSAKSGLDKCMTDDTCSVPGAVGFMFTCVTEVEDVACGIDAYEVAGCTGESVVVRMSLCDSRCVLKDPCS